MGSQHFGPHINKPSHHSFNIAKLTVNAENLIKSVSGYVKSVIVVTNNMTKKIAAQKKEAGKERTNSG